MTISIRLDPGLKTVLQRRLSKRDVPVSVFAREVISEKLGREEQEIGPYAIGKSLFGRCSSGETDRSERRKQIIWEWLGEKRRRSQRSADCAVRRLGSLSRTGRCVRAGYAQTTGYQLTGHHGSRLHAGFAPQAQRGFLFCLFLG